MQEKNYFVLLQVRGTNADERRKWMDTVSFRKGTRVKKALQNVVSRMHR
jgi:hypothetical protein